MRVTFLLLIICTLVSCDERLTTEEVDQRLIERLEWSREVRKKIRVVEQDARDKADEIEYAERKRRDEAEKQDVKMYQQWATLNDGTSKGATILSLNKDAGGNYINLTVFVDNNINGAVLAYQNLRRKRKTAVGSVKVEFLFDRVKHLELYMRYWNGDQAFIGKEVKAAVEYSNMTLMRVTQQNGEACTYQFDTRNFPANHFTTTILHKFDE
tara:strand:+ start:75 stop:710 length:636 start_codon:yes stop_codon:yes gene_type:complete